MLKRNGNYTHVYNSLKLAAAVFADTQDEPGAVYRHLDWLMAKVKTFPILVRTRGRLSDDLMRGENSTGQRFASIPAYTMAVDAEREGRTRRQCSKEYKIEVIDRTIRQEILGLAPKARVPKAVQVIQYVGISRDEAGRSVRLLRAKVPKKWKEQAERWDYGRLIEFFNNRNWAFRFPLIDMFATRANCLEFLKGRVPHKTPRSACVFCPFHDDIEWAAVKEVPEDWDLAVRVDEALRKPGNIVNRNMDQAMYLHRSCKPLQLVQLDPSADPRAAQMPMNFTAECMGVCGI